MLSIGQNPHQCIMAAGTLPEEALHLCEVWSRCGSAKCGKDAWPEMNVTTSVLTAGTLPEEALDLCEVEPLRQEDPGSAVWIPDELQVK